ncbi:MAG: hypothetical protein RLZZ245_2707 [Verrucomicrobiota bacterium]
MLVIASNGVGNVQDKLVKGLIRLIPLQTKPGGFRFSIQQALSHLKRHIALFFKLTECQFSEYCIRRILTP